MNATIASLATEFGMENYAVLEALDIPGTLESDNVEIDSIDGWTEAEAREVLTLMTQQAADRD